MSPPNTEMDESLVGTPGLCTDVENLNVRLSTDTLSYSFDTADLGMLAEQEIVKSRVSKGNGYAEKNEEASMNTRRGDLKVEGQTASGEEQMEAGTDINTSKSTKILLLELRQLLNPIEPASKMKSTESPEPKDDVSFQDDTKCPEVLRDELIQLLESFKKSLNSMQ